MYAFGIDIPLVEIIIGVMLISLIMLIEITIILILITFHMRNSKKLENEIGRLSTTLMRLQGRELKEIAKLQKMTDTGKVKLKPPPEKNIVKKEVKKDMKIKKPKSDLFKKIDQIIGRK